MLDASRMELLQYSNWATTLKEGSLWAKNDKRPIGRPYSLSSTVESITELFFSRQGLSGLSRLQHLSLAHNHLARVSEIDNCLLLQTLNLRANNLLEVSRLHLSKCAR